MTTTTVTMKAAATASEAVSIAPMSSAVPTSTSASSVANATSVTSAYATTCGPTAGAQVLSSLPMALQTNVIGFIDWRQVFAEMEGSALYEDIQRLMVVINRDTKSYRKILFEYMAEYWRDRIALRHHPTSCMAKDAVARKRKHIRYYIRRIVGLKRQARALQPKNIHYVSKHYRPDMPHQVLEYFRQRCKPLHFDNIVTMFCASAPNCMAIDGRFSKEFFDRINMTL